MAAPAARSIHVAGQSTSNAGSCQPTSTTVQAALPFTMLMPWMPMMMPPWMPMFGMLPGSKSALMPPMSMPMALPGMMGRQAAPSAQAAPALANKAAAAPAVAPTALQPPATTAAAAAAAEQEDEDLGFKPDEEVTVEPEELAVFEKVAAMEREQTQQRQQQSKAPQQFERASSPSGSCHTTVNGGSSSSTPCSPMSALQPMPFPPGMGCFPFPGFPCMPMGPMPGCFPVPAQPMQQQPQPQQQAVKQPTQQQWQKQAQQLWKPQQQQGGDADAAPVPWTSFAADDCGDDLDKDLQELIMLPADCLQQDRGAAPGSHPDPAAAAAAAAAPTPAPAAAAKARSSSLKRIGSTASAVSTADAVTGVLGQSVANGSKAKRVLRIRSNSNKASAASSGCNGGSSSTCRIVLKGSTAKRSGSNQQQQGAGALGVSKGGVQKKVTVSAVKASAVVSSHTKASAGSPAQGSALGAGVQLPALAHKAQDQQQAMPNGMPMDEEEPCLNLLCDLDSSLSGGDAMTAGVMPADNYWDSFMQEASDDGWDSLLGNNELDFVTAGL